MRRWLHIELQTLVDTNQIDSDHVLSYLSMPQPIIARDSDHQPAEEELVPTPITEQELGEYREQDRFLPIANVARIMKASVPSTAKIAKDAKECVQECVSEFISFITSEAAEKCVLEKRKTIGGEDILYAMTTLGFENYSETLKIHLAKLRAQQNASNASSSHSQQPREIEPRMETD